jgi:predicted branched-subunit amino acid permease
MGRVAPIVMSILVFAGSAQFAATAVLAAGGGALAAIVAGVLLNARYAPMGVALAPSLRGSKRRRAAFGQALIDFSWAAASRGGGRFDPAYMLGAAAGRAAKPPPPAALGALIALLLVPITPAGVPIIAASAAALIGLGSPRTAEEDTRPDAEHAFKEGAP